MKTTIDSPSSDEFAKFVARVDADLAAKDALIATLSGTVSALTLRVFALEQKPVPTPEPIPAPPVPTGQVSIADIIVTEGDDTKLAQVIVSRTGGAGAFTVDYATEDGSAVAGEDYLPAHGTVIFTVADVQQIIPLTILGGDEAEGDEFFTVRLSNPTAGVEIGHGECHVLIHDDDVAGFVSVADASVAEGDAGTALLTFKITRTDGGAPFQVDCNTLGGTATAGVDYVAASDTLSFARGQMELAITIAVNGDLVVEGDEVMSLVLSNPTNGAILGRDRATGTITDDDVAPPPPQPPPPPSTTTRQLAIEINGGPTVVFREDQAVDRGDYVGPFVHQKCFRQIASGNGDYRDAFLVDFRPDADGAREEVVIEFGTLFKFPAVGSPVPASGVAPLHLGLPPMPVLTKTTGGTSAQVGSLAVAVTYVTPDGETPASQAWLVMKVGERAVVKSPPPGMGATHYKVYATLYGVTPGNVAVLQSASPVPLGIDWTEPEAGVVLTGARLPMVRPKTWAYRATLSGGNLAAPITETFPVHYWRSRGRIHTGNRPIMRTLADLAAMKAVLPLDKRYAYGAPSQPLRAWEGPMDKGPIYTGMSGAGGRPDIGFLTEWTADFLVNRTATAESNMRASAEAAGSFAVWVRDAATGALVNTATVPGLPAFVDAWHGPKQIPSVPGEWVSWSYIYGDESHMPAFAFAPYMLTDDPYYLEGAQAVANYGILETNIYRNGDNLPALASAISPRAFAWNARDIFQLAGYMPPNTPSWLLPLSHWRDQVVPQQVEYGMRYVTAAAAPGASPCLSVFKTWIITSVTPAFIGNYYCLVMAWIKWCGKFPEYDPVVQYATEYKIVTSDPADPVGWDHRWPEPYYMYISDARKGLAAVSTHVGEGWRIKNSPDTATTWAEFFSWYLVLAPSKGWPTNPETWPADGYPVRNFYIPWWRSALAALSLAGLPRAREGHDFTARQLDKDHAYGDANGFTWAISPE